MLFGAVLLGMLAGTPLAQAQDAASLKLRHAALRAQLASNPFHRPIHLESQESPGELKGDIYAQLDQPYAVAGPALQDIEHWCDILILHQNVKACRSGSLQPADTLRLDIGRKFDQPLADAYPFEFRHKVVVSRPDYLQVVLTAEQGPLGTSRYRIALEVLALDTRHSFLHLTYSYAYGMTARLAMQGYLATGGRDKRGFGIVGTAANGQPVYLGGVRGVVERNTMRYYLAVEAYLGALSVPANARLEKRLNDWYSGVERYPVQLHELQRAAYLDMKHREIRRQQALPPVSAAP